MSSKSKSTPKPIKKAKKKISEIKSQYSINLLKDNHSKYKNIEQRIKRGKIGLSNDESKKLYLIYCTYLNANEKVQKYNKKNNIVILPRRKLVKIWDQLYKPCLIHYQS